MAGQSSSLERGKRRAHGLLDGLASVCALADGELFELVHERVATVDDVRKLDDVKLGVRDLHEALDTPDEVGSEDADGVLDDLWDIVQ